MSSRGKADTMQWGPIFWEEEMRIAPLINTEGWGEITSDSIVGDLFVLGGRGDIEALRKKYVGLKFSEFAKLILKE